MKTKAYIKPELLVVGLKMQTLLNSNSVTSVTGVEDLDVNGDEFNGTADSRRRRNQNAWEEDEEFDEEENL